MVGRSKVDEMKTEDIQNIRWDIGKRVKYQEGYTEINKDKVDKKNIKYI